MLTEAGRSVIIPSETSLALAWVERPLNQEDAITP